MKANIYYIAFIVILLSVSIWESERIKVIKSEREMYRQNMNNLLGETERYRTKDSLNVASIGELHLTINEYKKFRQEDMKLIETLQVDKKRLQQITTAQTQTIYELSGSVKDSIVYRDNYITDTLRCIDIADKWFDLHGCIDSKFKFAGRFENRDSLLYVEHVIPKRFLFFKWGCKERRQEIVSKNPHTVITCAEFISIRK